MAARRTSHPWQAALALALAWVLAAPAARAELNLKWDAPPGCPRGSEVLDRIRALAGSSLDKTEGLSAEGRIAPANGPVPSHAARARRPRRAKARDRLRLVRGSRGRRRHHPGAAAGHRRERGRPGRGSSEGRRLGRGRARRPSERGSADRGAPSREEDRRTQGSENRGAQSDEPAEQNPSPVRGSRHRAAGTSWYEPRSWSPIWGRYRTRRSARGSVSACATTRGESCSPATST